MFRRRIALLLSAGTLAVGLSAASAGIAHAVTPTPSSNWNELVSSWANSGNTMCVDDPGHSTIFNTQLQLFHCHGYASNGAPQRWFFNPTFTEDGTAAYIIYLANTLSTDGNDPNDVMCIHYWNNVRVDGQRMALGNCFPREIDWVMEPGNPGLGNNNFMLRDSENNLCLSAANFSDSNGTGLIAATCDPYDPTQDFWLG